MHPFAAATAPSVLVLLLLLLFFSLSTTQYSLADANYNEISPISTDSHINQVIFDSDHHNSSLPLLIQNNKNEDGGKTYEFNITAGKFFYLMTLQLVLKDHKDDVEAYGTPDTGSNLIWLNLNCETTTATAAAATDECIKIKEPETTFECHSGAEDPCKKMWSDLGMEEQDPDKCIKSTDHKDKCGYKIIYKDGSYSKGYFGEGGFRDSHDQEFKVKYGVSTDTGPKEKNSIGVVGLGRGDLSLFQQRKNVDFKFSYCLPQYEEKDQSNENALATSKLVFGSQVNTNPETSIKFLDKYEATDKKECATHLYCISLTSIYVKGHDKEEPEKKITVKEKGTTEVMIIDSGTTFTYLRGDVFDRFLDHVKQQIGDWENLENPYGYEHCFLKGSAEKLEKVSLGFKRTTVEPKDELKVELKRENIFDLMNKNGKDYRCLTVKKTDDVHILGSRAQVDFEVKFDLSKKEKEVSFDKKGTCNLEKKKNSNDVE